MCTANSPQTQLKFLGNIFDSRNEFFDPHFDSDDLAAVELLSWYLYIYAHICTYIYIYTHMYVQTCAGYLYIHTYIHM